MWIIRVHVCDGGGGGCDAYSLECMITLESQVRSLEEVAGNIRDTIVVPLQEIFDLTNPIESPAPKRPGRSKGNHSTAASIDSGNSAKSASNVHM